MFIFSNLATSIDGKIATRSREFFPLGTPEDRRIMIKLRKKSDVVIMGASTLRTYRKFCGVGRDESRQPANAIISNALEGVSPNWPFFADPGRKRILFVTEALPTRRLKQFEATSEVVRLKRPTKKRPVALQVVEALGERGFERLLVEGGGGIMWDFASQNLIDEYYVTLTPKVVGGKDAPTLVDGAGFDPSGVLNLRLAKCRRIGDELYLTYLKT